MASKTIIAVLIALLAYLLLWPVPIDPQAWDAPDNQGYTGDFPVNTELENFEALPLDGLHGAEAVIQGRGGRLYATTEEGWLLRWLDTRQPKKWVKVECRPLGMAVDIDNNVWVACPDVGLMKVTPAGEVSVELTEVADKKLGYADDLDIAKNGKIYFSDASTKFHPADWGGTLQASLLDIIEHGAHGRVIEFDPNTNIARVVMDGLDFPNGVAVDPAQQFILVAETGSYQILKLWIAGDRAGQSEIIINNLPGFPDNVHVGMQGRFWVGLAAPRAAILDKLSDSPFLRKVVQRFPEFMRPQVVHYGAVFAIDGNGAVVRNLQAPSGAVYATTGVAETAEFLYITSLTAPFLAKIAK